MDELIKTLNRMIDTLERNNEIARRIEEQTRSLAEIDNRIDKIIGAAK